MHDHPEILQAPQRQFSQVACQIPKQYHNLNYQTHDSRLHDKTSCLILKWGPGIDLTVVKFNCMGVNLVIDLLLCFRQDVSLSLYSGVCFTDILWALQNILLQFMYCRNHTSDKNFKLKLCTCAQSHALGTCTKFQLEILTISVICGIV